MRNCFGDLVRGSLLGLALVSASVVPVACDRGDGEEALEEIKDEIEDIGDEIEDEIDDHS